MPKNVEGPFNGGLEFNSAQFRHPAAYFLFSIFMLFCPNYCNLNDSGSSDHSDKGDIQLFGLSDGSDNAIFGQIGFRITLCRMKPN